MTTVKLFTLIFVKNHNKVLLGYKTRGLGVGLWNGFGGKVEPGESLLNCAYRELKEECDLTADNLNHIGVVKYEVVNGLVVSIIHVFTCDKFSGKEQPSEEMCPVKWYGFEQIPYEIMWPDARSWMPLMLKDKFFSTHCLYGENGKILTNRVFEVDSIAQALEIVD